MSYLAYGRVLTNTLHVSPESSEAALGIKGTQGINTAHEDVGKTYGLHKACTSELSIREICRAIINPFGVWTIPSNRMLWIVVGCSLYVLYASTRLTYLWYNNYDWYTRVRPTLNRATICYWSCYPRTVIAIQRADELGPLFGVSI